MITPDLVFKALEEFGAPVVFGLLGLYVAFRYHILFVRQVEARLIDMKGQMDKLAADNNLYRRFYFKEKGHSDEELKQFFPGYELPETGRPNKEEKK